MQVKRPELPCPFQCLYMSISPSSHDVMGMFPINSSTLIDNATTSIVINIAGLPARQQYYSNFSIVDEDGSVVDAAMALHFSERNKLVMFSRTELLSLL